MSCLSHSFTSTMSQEASVSRRRFSNFELRFARRAARSGCTLSFWPHTAQTTLQNMTGGCYDARQLGGRLSSLLATDDAECQDAGRCLPGTKHDQTILPVSRSRDCGSRAHLRPVPVLHFSCLSVSSRPVALIRYRYGPNRRLCFTLLKHCLLRDLSA